MRETEAFIKKCRLPGAIPVAVVNESGASIYSASEVAREEFPDLDLTVRGVVSMKPAPVRVKPGERRNKGNTRDVLCHGAKSAPQVDWFAAAMNRKN